jgi:hypothetical protein
MYYFTTQKYSHVPFRLNYLIKIIGVHIKNMFFCGGAYQHCSHEGLLYSNPPVEFRHSSPEALHTKRRQRPLLANDGTKAKEFS